MPLNARQRRLYRHTCDVWRATIQIQDDGAPGEKTWTRVASGVQCYFRRMPSNSLPEIVGRIEQDIIFTLDNVHFASDADVQDADVLKNTTSADLPRYNRFWSVRGEAQDTGGKTGAGDAYGGRDVNNKVFVANLLEPNMVPDGVS